MKLKRFISILLAAMIAATLVGNVYSGGGTTYLPLVVNEQQTPTSGQLIAQALAAGRLDANTAAVYLVYTLLPNSPLPPEYQGAQDPEVDVAPFAALWKVYPALSPAQKAAVDPYLRRPDNPTSAYFLFQQQQPAASQAGSDPVISSTRPPDTIQWTSLVTKTGVKIHYRKDINGDDVRATGVGAAIDATIYTSLNTLMGRIWMDDTNCANEGGVENGGGLALDIYLMHGMGLDRGLEVSCGETPTPGWVLLNADRPIGDATHIGMVQTAAHEMFHAIQDSYAYLNDSSTYLWMQEATAKWVEDFVYPKAQSEQDYAHLYMDTTYDPVDYNPDGLRYYGDYLWPFYLTRVKGYAPSIIRTMFENAKSYPSTDIFMLQAGQDSPVPLFPNFAVQNWNEAPFNDYNTKDSLTTEVKVQQRTVISGVVKKQPYIMPGRSPGKYEHLSVWYYDYVFDDDTARTVTFYNGISYKLTEGSGWPLTAGDKFYKTDPLTSDQYKGMNVQALIKINNVWKLEDWSNISTQVYCRDRAAQNIQELALIVTNSNFKESQTNYDFRPIGNNPTLLVSPTGCYQWKGSFDVEDTSDPGVTHSITGNVVFEASDTLYGPSVLYSLKSGQAYLKISGTSSDQNYIYSVGGWATLGPNDPPAFNFLGTYNMVTGGPHPNAYYGKGFSNQTVTGTLKSCCDEDGHWITDANYPFTIGTWFLAPNLPANLMLSQSQGDIIAGSYTDTGSHITYSWNFKEQKDP